MPAKPTRQAEHPFLSPALERRLKEAEQLLTEARTHPTTLSAMIYAIERSEDLIRGVQRETRWREL